MSSAVRLFVYGSLKRGLSNHHMLAGAEYLGPSRTAPLYRLLDLGAYPGLAAAGQRSISGELYRVPRSLLGSLDDFEGEQYERAVIVLSDAEPAEAYLLAESARAGAVELDCDSWPQR
ncbi:MAG: gamma-glutamylcyclotransferase family protein [Polyangiaceae bacterium]